MLVSLIGQLQAINMRHNAAYNMMSIAHSQIGMIRNMNFTSGMSEVNMQRLHQADLNMSLDFEKNKLLYQIACAQEEAFKKRQAQDIKRMFDVSA